MYFRSLCIFYPCFSQNDRYLVLTAKLLDAKAAAALAKEDGDKKGQKEATTNIRTYSQGTPLVYKRKGDMQRKLGGQDWVT